MELLESAPQIRYFGEFLSLAAAFAWASAVILFRISGKSIHPLGLNLFKSIFASLLVLLTMLALNQQIMIQASLQKYELMLASGVIGISLSDTLLLASLNLLGASLTAVVDFFIAFS